MVFNMSNTIDNSTIFDQYECEKPKEKVRLKRGPHLSYDQQELIKLEISELLVRNHTALQIQASIAAKYEIELSTQAIQYYKFQLRKEWHREAMVNIQEQIAVELEGLAEQERQCWSAWTLSLQPAETISYESILTSADLDADFVDDLKGVSKERKTKLKKYYNSVVNEERNNIRSGKSEVLNLLKESYKATGQCGNPQYQVLLLAIRRLRSEYLGILGDKQKDLDKANSDLANEKLKNILELDARRPIEQLLLDSGIQIDIESESLNCENLNSESDIDSELSGSKLPSPSAASGEARSAQNNQTATDNNELLEAMELELTPEEIEIEKQNDFDEFAK